MKILRLEARPKKSVSPLDKLMLGTFGAVHVAMARTNKRVEQLECEQRAAQQRAQDRPSDYVV